MLMVLLRIYPHCGYIYMGMVWILFFTANKLKSPYQRAELERTRNEIVTIIRKAVLYLELMKMLILIRSTEAKNR